MGKSQELTVLIFKAVALAMAVASVVLSVLRVAPIEVNVTLLSLGLFALAVAVLPKAKP